MIMMKANSQPFSSRLGTARGGQFARLPWWSLRLGAARGVLFTGLPLLLVVFDVPAVKMRCDSPSSQQKDDQ